MNKNKKIKLKGSSIFNKNKPLNRKSKPQKKIRTTSFSTKGPLNKTTKTKDNIFKC